MPTRFIKESCRTSRNLQALSDFAERLFWRLLTTADDYGRCLACPEIVKSVCFPLDDKLPLKKIISGLLELSQQDLVTLYRVKDRQYAQFVTFSTHQGNPRAKKSKYPDSSPTYTSMQADAITCVQLLADVTGHPDTDTDTDSKTNPDSGSSLSSLSSFPKSEECIEFANSEKALLSELVALWNEIPGVSRMQSVGGPVKTRLIARIRDHPDLDWWRSLFQRVQQSDFLCGRKTDFAASLDWVLGPKNLAKIEAGNYDNRAHIAQKPKSMVDLL